MDVALWNISLMQDYVLYFCRLCQFVVNYSVFQRSSFTLLLQELLIPCPSELDTLGPQHWAAYLYGPVPGNSYACA